MDDQSLGCCNPVNEGASISSRNDKINNPRIVSREEWHKVHQAFLEKEKAFTRARDELNEKRRQLPMMEVTKSYVFNGTDGTSSLLELFAGRSQLIVYHFMFDPSWEEGCDGCSMMVDNMGHPVHLNTRDTTLVLVSRAPLEKIEPFKARMGWSIPWYSSFLSEFNYDFGATTKEGETHGYSVFLLEDNRIYHTYSTWARGVEYLGSNWSYLDISPRGRQELWENSPPKIDQTATYEWWRHHDRYEE
ncbi:DUF899 domain-containing protein [Virgibacillus necropolis]|uniref:Thioredoxin n=1 Tax=Virgibacillus necropolis TaxID=163877 RepID=A0A221MF12_9BACI|nr:DUF899 domain-containing protein [Virgibacillus necropolis]ASN06169.1 hypothetical protein CFK40_14640 [Virgibacillus necropolis]